MKLSWRRRLFNRLGRWFKLHPDVGGLISGAGRLVNPHRAALPLENLPLASRIMASGLWNYSFFQYYPGIVGPRWVEQQYDPESSSFIPRAGSLLSVNLTLRNWMGVRGFHARNFALIDTVGALGPVVGYYSIEFGLRIGSRIYLASRGEINITQTLRKDTPVPMTIFKRDGVDVRWTVSGSNSNDDLILSRLQYNCPANQDISLLLSIRPFQPEGAALIHRMIYRHRGDHGLVDINGINEIYMVQAPDSVSSGNLLDGDAYFNTPHSGKGDIEEQCSFGVSTMTMHFDLKSRQGEFAFIARTYERELVSNKDARAVDHILRSMSNKRRLSGTHLPKPRLVKKRKAGHTHLIRKIKNIETHNLFSSNQNLQIEDRAVKQSIRRSIRRWQKTIAGGAGFRSGNDIWDQAARVYKGFALTLQTGNEVTPGIFTYRLFWFRDAAYMLSALAGWNYLDQTRRVLETYPSRQDRNGFFRSQEGEWDSNGQAIWALTQYAKLSGDLEFLKRMLPSIESGARWIIRKRRKGLHKKIMPAGWSAEHLGPADYYYWDNLWSLAGLRETAHAYDKLGKPDAVAHWRAQYALYRQDILDISKPDRNANGILSAAPDRIPDAGVIGNICALYPLQLDIFHSDLMRDTIAYLRNDHFRKNLFYQTIIHSGYNVYLSLQVAQALLRMGYARDARRILRTALKKRQDLWTYPEAIHPRTGGGVMGDGFHGWAFAEMLLLLRAFVLYDENDRLWLLRGFRFQDIICNNLELGPFPIDGALLIIKGNLKADGTGKLQLKFNRSLTIIRYLNLCLPRKFANPVKIDGARILERDNHCFQLHDLRTEINLIF